MPLTNCIHIFNTCTNNLAIIWFYAVLVPGPVWLDWVIYWTLGKFLSLWQQLFSPTLPHSWAIFVKVTKYIIFLVKSFLSNFYRHLAIFFWSHCSCINLINSKYIISPLKSFVHRVATIHKNISVFTQTTYCYIGRYIGTRCRRKSVIGNRCSMMCESLLSLLATRRFMHMMQH